MTTLHTANATDFAASLVTETGAAPLVRFDGRAEAAAKEVLASFLQTVDLHLMKLAATEVSVDFRELTFMNSSCFKDFVVWLSEVRKRPAPQQYRLRFVSNPKIRWQRASLASLSCFAVDLVEIVAD